MNGHLKSINLTSLASTIKWNMIEFFKLLISQFIVSLLCSEYLWNHLYRHTIISWNAHYAFFRVIGGLRASSFENLNWLIGSYSGFGKILTSELVLPRRDPSFSSTSWCVYGLTMGPYFMFGCCINKRVQVFPGLSHVDNRAHQEIFRFTRQ